MIRTLSFHPLSLLVGLVLGIACLLAMGQSPPSPAFRIEYGPAPRDMVQIAPGTTYAVPAGKVFVPTALGSSAFGVPVARLIVNDQPVLGVADYTNSLYLTSMYPVCEAMAIPDGSVISIRTPPGGNLGQAWGYLANKLTESPGSPPTYRVAYSPHPSDLVQVTLGTPYVVPPGKVFTLTGLGVASGINAPPSAPRRVPTEASISSP
jgi:hypothetical protein